MTQKQVVKNINHQQARNIFGNLSLPNQILNCSAVQ